MRKLRLIVGLLTKHFRSETFWTFIIIGTIFTLSAVPWIVKATNTPRGATFLPVHNSLSDYPFYTSIIAQGLAGQQMVYNRFTTEEQTGSPILGLYLIIGLIARVLGLADVHAVYHLARFILGGIWFMVIIWLTRKLLKSRLERLAALAFIAFSSSWPVFSRTPAGMAVSWHMSWWTELDPMQRAAFLPHYMIGHIMLVVVLGLFLTIPRLNWRNIIFIGANLWIMGFVHPPSFIICALVMITWTILTGRIRKLIKSIPGFILGSTSLVIIYRQYQIFPWSLSRGFEGLSFALDMGEYLLALGPVAVLGAIGFILIFANKSNKTDRVRFLALFLWIIISLVLVDRVRFFPFSSSALIRRLAVSNIRFLQVAIWVPLALAAAKTIYIIRRRFGFWVSAGLWTVLAALTFIGYPASMRTEAQKLYAGWYFSYPTDRFMSAVRSLAEITLPAETVLAMPLIGQIIPGYINRTVYTSGQIYQTYNIDEKMGKAWRFYRGELSDCEAYRLLKDNRIKSIFYGYDERNIGEGVKSYSFVLPWKDYSEVAVYRFIDAKPVECE
ncbi:hypothetical protein A2154_03840 [Candidatus Gottesmanbacteria bacterium RBG_16_43_7]|uniref:Glycosyltransferase RgtA/B/C/D-like domain-containing protein n=1 Tax=Candidatus Gottesmanbacteria bacterium RBG_16_43_7 TaxID=1798373 RepID=A0A1F5Z956_9BACT|nr:MAG: hypothetical protein A2154_03840 [Candidatus Gottesmanbacteria bacterium RBG_16_43_7]